MAGKRIEYTIVGRYMDGNEVTGYHLQSLEAGKAGRYTREQICYLVGRGQISNCSGQIYKDKVILRGEGCNLDDLPVQQENGALKKTDSVGRVKKGTTGADAMQQLMLVGCIVQGKNTIGYEVRNAGGAVKNFKRDQVLQLAKDGKIGNARVQVYSGKDLLRGVGCNLNELPVKRVDPPVQASQQSAITQAAATTEKPARAVTKPDKKEEREQEIVYWNGGLASIDINKGEKWEIVGQGHSDISAQTFYCIANASGERAAVNHQDAAILSVLNMVYFNGKKVGLKVDNGSSNKQVSKCELNWNYKQAPYYFKISGSGGKYTDLIDSFEGYKECPDYADGRILKETVEYVGIMDVGAALRKKPITLLKAARKRAIEWSCRHEKDANIMHRALSYVNSL